MKATRKEAIAALEKWYFTGKPCKFGHLSKRSTIDGSCYECRITNKREDAKKLRELFRNVQ